MSTEEGRKRRYPISWIAIGVTIVSYFGIKYGIAARYYDVNDTNNLLYNLGLIFACVFLGRAVDSWVKSRKQQQQ